MVGSLLWGRTLITIFFITSLCRAELVIEPEFGYIVNLPDNWVRTVRSDSHHVFLDNSLNYNSTVSIRRYSINSSEYSSGKEWVRINYIAYLLAVEYSVLPYGSTIYFDSSASRVKQGHWSPEAWSYFFTVDTVPNYSEFIIYSEAENYGYEMYALGDSADMAANIAFYLNILDSITLPQATSISVWNKSVQSNNIRQYMNGNGVEVCDILGRKLYLNSESTKPNPPVIYFRRGQKILPATGPND